MKFFRGKNEKPDRKVYGNIKYFTMVAHSLFVPSISLCGGKRVPFKNNNTVVVGHGYVFQGLCGISFVVELAITLFASFSVSLFLHLPKRGFMNVAVGNFSLIRTFAEHFLMSSHDRIFIHQTRFSVMCQRGL